MVGAGKYGQQLGFMIYKQDGAQFSKKNCITEDHRVLEGGLYNILGRIILYYRVNHIIFKKRLSSVTGGLYNI